MKWVKASERLPANAESTITRWYHNGEKIELMSSHYIKDWANLNKIELDDIEWLDESEQQNDWQLETIAKMKEVEVLQQEFENAVAICADNNIQLTAKDAEIERLKVIIRTLHDRHLITKKDREGLWACFAKENNL